MNEFLSTNKQFWEDFFPSTTALSDEAIMVELLISHIGYLMGNCIIAKYLQKRLKTRIIGILPPKTSPNYGFTLNIAQSYGITEFIDQDLDIGFNFDMNAENFDHSDIRALREEFINMEFDGVPLGDLAYDNYLRTTGKGTIEKVDHEVVNHLASIIRDYVFYDMIIKQQKVVATVQGHTVYNYGAMARAALKNGAVVYGKKPAGNPLTVRRYTTLAEKRQYEFRLTQDEFSQLISTKKEFAVQKGRQLMDERIKGGTNSEFSGAYGEGKKLYSREELIKKLNLTTDKPIVCIMSHLFPDSPHAFNSILYNDYYEWLEETLLAIKDIPEINWLVKEHPHLEHYNPRHSTTELATPFAKKYPHINLTPGDLDTNSLLPVVHAIVTCAGTAGLEFSTQGIPCILAGESHYSGFGFTIEAKSKEGYVEQLKNVGKLEKLSQDKIDLALAYTYAFFKLVRVHCALLPKISDRFFDKTDISQTIKEATDILKNINPEDDPTYINFNRQLDTKAAHMINFDVLSK